MTVHRLWSHETSLAAEGSSAARARAFVSRHLRDHDLPHLVDDIKVVASELATNAMAHAQTPFTVILCAFDETVVLEVSDQSRAEPSLVVARALDTSGRGVAIVQALSRDWGVLSRASGGKSVWAEFDSTARPRAPLGPTPGRNGSGAARAHRHFTGFSQGAPH
jgi:anti-sigma regulatory factor (Ser/Thr protein kinase)